jgi:hypothetical protein
MVVSEIELYEILSAKIGKQEAKALAEFVETKVEKQRVDKLSAFATKEYLVREVSSLEVRLTRNIYIVGVVQFLAIAGSVLMLLKLHVG